MNALKKKILLVEDDLNLGFVIKDNLEQSGFNVTHSTDGADGLNHFCKGNFDLCILDIMLPKKDGYALAQDIRAIDKHVPVIFLTAKSQPLDKIKGLRIGADDYITKPFLFEELLLRIEAILKRTNATMDERENKNLFHIGHYLFDYNKLELKFRESVKILTKKEANLLRLLCIYQDKILERETALKIIWGNNDYFLGRSMDVFITRLRKYLKQDPRIKIVNIHGIGFKMTVASKG